MYKGLASYFLIDGVFGYFNVVDFVNEPMSEDKLYATLLYLYLGERDNSPEEMSFSTPP